MATKKDVTFFDVRMGEKGGYVIRVYAGGQGDLFIVATFDDLILWINENVKRIEA